MLLRDRHVTEWQFLAVFALSGGVVDVAVVSEAVAGRDQTITSYRQTGELAR
jgi:hypothetical protein